MIDPIAYFEDPILTIVTRMHLADEKLKHNGETMVGKRMMTVAQIAIALGLREKDLPGIAQAMKAFIARHHRHSEGMESHEPG